jgi:hypothetical protein
MFTDSRLILVACVFAIPTSTWVGCALAQSYPDQTRESETHPFTFESLLPRSISQNLDVNAWGWFSYLRDDDRAEPNYWDGDVALGATQRIGDHLAVTADIHYLDENNHSRGFLEQAFATGQVSETTGTLITAGKFNAGFGMEPRNEWDRLSGTPSLLFGAQPQDLVGMMITQPLGEGGISLRPFVTSELDGRSSFRGPPSEGLLAQYKPNDSLTMNFTNWVGPGFRAEESESESASTDDYSLANWTGPDVHGNPGGMLLFSDASVRWMPAHDWTLLAEGLIAVNGQSPRQLAWTGAAFAANFDLTDHVRIFGRWSYLNDAQGLVTGIQQSRNEFSTGAALQIFQGAELRGEYRHDFAPSGDLDTESIHMTFSL